MAAGLPASVPHAAPTTYAELEGWRVVGVEGADALRWLHDLLSADLLDLGPGEARRALLLAPTGAVRAECTVAHLGDGVVLLQDPAQPRPIDELLAPYVLSSDVRLEDRSQALRTFALPGGVHEALPGATRRTAPSALGAGVDLWCRAEDAPAVREALGATRRAATGAEIEAWRIAAGRPRFAVDAREGDLPAECGLDDAVSTTKGCFLGQEAVARVRNLGHPRRVLVHVVADGTVRPGEPVLAEDRETGEVTSAAELDGRTYALVRIGWADREADLRTPGGVDLHTIACVGGPPSSRGSGESRG
jgi:folate-binding protein YgfZ